MNVKDLETNLKEKIEEENILILKGKEINLSRLKINFKLNEQQENCLNLLCDFLINKNDVSFCLSGYAGTGKSSIVKILLKWIDINFSFYDFQITAPTHRAKYIIEDLSGSKAKTIQSILGLRPDVDIEKLDFKNVKYNNKSKPQMPKHLLIIDESSMINDFLFKMIIEQCVKFNCQVIFIGDKAQLKPVKQSNISKVFSVNNKYELTKVERQKNSNPLGGILFDIRNNIFSEKPVFEFQSILNDKEEGIEFTDNSSEFLTNSLIDAKNVVYYTEYLYTRLLAFTNARVALYNKLIRQKLGFKEEYNKGELLMAYANVGKEEDYNLIINSCDYIIENEPKLIKRFFHSIPLYGYDVDLISTDCKNRCRQFIVSSNEDFNSKETIEKMAEKIEEIRYEALFAKERHKVASKWREYYELKDSFIGPMDFISDGRIIKSKSIDYAYSHTIHKSQGGTYKTVFVDFRDINICQDIEQRNQLLYVALSRCTKKATLFY